MNNSSVAKVDDKNIAKGSVADVARANGTTVAKAFLAADVVVIVDTSGSMGARDSRGGNSRYDIAVEELRKVQERNPGAVAVVSFSDSVEFCPDGNPINLSGGTDVESALKYVKQVDGMVKFVLISDGEPDDEQDALNVAKTFKSKVNTIYVGPEIGNGGRDFLRRLANLTGGQMSDSKFAVDLADKVTPLLHSGNSGVINL